VTVENKAVVVFVLVGIVAVDFHDFGYEAPAGAAFQVDDDVYGIADIGFDRASAFFQERCVATDSTVNFEPLPFA
jgi:hypothetical protein